MKKYRIFIIFTILAEIGYREITYGSERIAPNHVNNTIAAAKIYTAGK